MHHLRQFLDILQREGELVRVETLISSDFEIAASSLLRLHAQGYPVELTIDEITAKKITDRCSEYLSSGNAEGEEERTGYTGFSLLD